MESDHLEWVDHSLVHKSDFFLYLSVLFAQLILVDEYSIFQEKFHITFVFVLHKNGMQLKNIYQIKMFV